MFFLIWLNCQIRETFAEGLEELDLEGGGVALRHIDLQSRLASSCASHPE